MGPKKNALKCGYPYKAGPLNRGFLTLQKPRKNSGLEQCVLSKRDALK